MKGAKGTRPKGKINDSKKRKRATGKDEAVKKLRGPPTHIPLAEADDSEVEDQGNDLDQNEVDMATAAQFAGGLDVKQITKSALVSGGMLLKLRVIQISKGIEEGTSQVETKGWLNAFKNLSHAQSHAEN